MTRALSWVALSGALLLLACAHTPRREPKLRIPAAQAKPAARPEGPVPELVEVRVLVVSYRGAREAKSEITRSKDQALERARMIARMARSGDKLAELVRKYSDRPGASDDLGLFRLRPAQPGAFGKSVAEAALSLTPGQVSDPVDAPEGFFVIERRSDPPGGPAEIAARHILVSYRGAPQAIEGSTRTEADARMLAEQIAKKAKEGADWKKLAAEYTEEPGSKETGGDLGRFGRGRMVGSFERAAFGLAVGEVSGVVQTPFGFHVIQRYQ